ncbi:phosphate ABC transporter substrate-binding protein [Coraliomargarita parva]|uniref:phosphate ABC transporter substrate-binding protein n=1 Tax=Coraliomargarita parva TaxID=3014050 RepID=UPI0022B3F035|nr:phosphate ABC transporter substrate-binding protein [Coraliomargarita parva]
MLRKSFIAIALLTCLFRTAGAETIVIMGSDTIGAKLVVLLAENFRAKMEARHTPVAFEISSEGSATALASVMEGKAEIGMSSKAPSSREKARASAKGAELRTITVAHDAIAIVVNAANPIESISLEELEMIYSGDVTDWSTITPEFTGEISAYTRNTASGTYSILQQVAMSSRDYGDNTRKMAGNEQIASEVASNAKGIGYVGLAYAQTPGLKIIPIEGVRPGEKEYPLARTLNFIIDSTKPLSPAANDFIGYTLSPEGQAVVSEVQFLPIY